MSDRLSVDDILNELSKKKNGNPSEAAFPFADESESLTDELAGIEARRFGTAAAAKKSREILRKSNGDLSVTDIIDGLSPREKSAGRGSAFRHAKTEEDLSAANAVEKSGEKPGEEKAEPFKPVRPVKIRRFSVPESQTPAPSEKTRQFRAERLSPYVPPPPARRLAVSKPSDEPPPEEDAPAVKAKPPAPKNALLPEEKARLQKIREEEFLGKDLALEDPDELISGINPYDVKKAEPPGTDVITGIKITRDIGDTAEIEDGNAEPDIKEYLPAAPKVMAKKGVRYPSVKSQKDKLSNSSLLESLNKSLAQKRESDINARKTLTVDTLSAISAPGNYKGRTLPSKLNIDYKRQIIEDSAVLPPTNLFSRQLEARELEKKKKRKIRDFILEDIDDDYEDDYEDDGESDDFESYDTSGQIWDDLNESHKGLKWRFVLLLVLNAVLILAAFLYESGGKLFYDVRDNMFNGELRAAATAFVYLNLVVGVTGVAVCSGVVLRGLQGLFSGKADCDSICAVPCVLLLLAAAVQLTNTSLLQQGKAHIYVSAALLTLFFNTTGKLLMIVRAKRNFRFISGDSAKFFAYAAETRDDEKSARIFTKGILSEMPVPVFLKKTEFLTDYLKNSYCTDLADLICRRLTPIGCAAALLAGIAAFFLSAGGEEMRRSVCWAVTAGGAMLALFSPFSVMFLVNGPLLRVSKTLSKYDCVVMGYKAAQKFSKANAVVIDAGLLFPAGSIKFLNVKRCQKPGTLDAVSIDESIVIAASLAIKTGSIMSYMFYDMISGDSELLYKIENCIYEVNMGITGWMGSKRVLLGNREQMKHHGIDIPDIKKERKHCPENGEVVYLAVGGETVAMFFIEVVPNGAVKSALRELSANGVALAVRTKDSLVTVNKLADIFELNPEKIRLLPFDLHKKFDDYSRYTSRGNSEIACNGTFTSFAKALVTAKTLIRDMTVTSAAMFTGLLFGGMLLFAFILFAATNMLSALSIIAYNAVWLVIVLILQGLRRY
ncbi:MAG: hypothetical protein LBI36_03970 [Oscillospiraceae bacterium]|jgi:Cu+-exporting ATPase|nr:hypothetical protein [Oscillospiraceae bacterium]